MCTNELPHDPAELLSELDAILAEREALKHRMVSLQARYKALEPHADRFDRYPAPSGERSQFGSVNIEATIDRLGYAIADDASGNERWLNVARETAVRIQEYPEQLRNARREDRDDQARTASADRSALANHRPGAGLADAIERNADRDGVAL
ncbi:hypothetical protein [Nocardia brasiliensis]|uniref:hypothetical protein n=1 Tax=Nocardia brasiliensis TaxID=37326 RepID=UPI002453A2E1|nr:hypothetical protein [Nocardia brasiliensis]